MNEIALSNELKQIEFEIDYHKGVAGRSVWEIGRRLNHVKENDLAHGEFMSWVEERGINQREANRLMRISKELPNSTTLSNLGETALYLIATLPEDERDKEHSTDKGESKTPNEMTVRELQQLKKQLSDQSESHQRQLKEKDEVVERYYQKIQELQDQEPVEIEVAPGDYDATKQRNKELEDNYKMLEESYEYARKQYSDLLTEREEVNNKSEKYDQLTESIRLAEGKLSKYQRQVANTKEILSFVNTGNNLLVEMGGLTYQDFEDVSEFELTELDKLLSRISNLVTDVQNKMNRPVIIEGEYTDE